MFTCPDKEIHSVYLDGELPAGLTADYEAHVASCKECQAQLQRLRAVREVLSRDKASIKVDDVFIEQSYKRLMARRKYSQVVSTARPAWGTNVMHGVWRALPAAAAAAVVAVVLPLRMTRGVSAQQEQEQQSGGTDFLASAPASVQQLGAVGQPPVFGDGNAGYGAFGMGQGASFGSLNMAQNASFGDMNGGGNSMRQMGKLQKEAGMGSRMMHRGRAFDGQGFYGQEFYGGGHEIFNGAGQSPVPDIAAIDVFRPDLDDETQTINIRISVPGLEGERAYTTIRVPVDVLNSAMETRSRHGEHHALDE